MKLNKKHFLLGLAFLSLTWIIIDFLRQPGPESLKGGFVEKAFVRNEQNTGPVLRIYVATVKDTLWTEMETYGNYKPHTKYGTTIVYFFLEGAPVPSKINIEGAHHINPEFQKYCVAEYKKSPMGQVILNKRPFNGFEF